MKAGSNESKADKTNLLLVACGATSHIITEKSKFTRFDRKFNSSKHYIELANGTRANNVPLCGKMWMLLFKIEMEHQVQGWN